jgi:hypothetical protein
MNALRHAPTWRILLAIVVACSAIAVGYYLWLTFWFTKPYREIAVGDSEQRVISLLGKPNNVRYSNTRVEYSWHTDEAFGVPGRDIVKEFTYRVPVIGGDEFVIGFDAQGRAVLKNRLISP